MRLMRWIGRKLLRMAEIIGENTPWYLEGMSPVNRPIEKTGLPLEDERKDNLR